MMLDLPKCVYILVQIIRDPVLSTEDASIRVYYESLKIAFPNICWLKNVVGEVCSLLVTPRRGAGRAFKISIRI